MSGPLRLRHRVGQAIAQGGLWRPGQRVAVAVSGGLDSTVLLDVLLETRGWHLGELSVVTVDHGVRPGSGDDAQAVARWAEELGLPCSVHTLSLGEGAGEAALREARYAVFDQLDVDVVALAHHRRDQAETLLMAALRGHGTLGLGAMRAHRGRYVRPLLAEPPQALSAWALHRGLTWREDPTNQDPSFLRNAIRHRLLPLLEELRPGAVDALARSARLCQADAGLLDALAADALSPQDALSVDALLALPEPLARRVLMMHLPGVRAAHIDAVVACLNRGSGEVALPGGATVLTQRGRVLVRREPS